MITELARDDDTMRFAAVDPAQPRPVEPQSMSWTWPVSHVLHEWVLGAVAETYHAWGRSQESADLLAGLAAELTTGDVLSGPYITVTVTIDDTRATLGAMTATGPQDPKTSPPSPPRHGHPPTSWGHHGEVGNAGAYAVINFARRPTP